MAKRNSNPRHSLRKRFLHLGLLLALFTIVLYVGNRMLSERNMVRSYEAPATTAETPTAFSDRLRIATFNIAHGRGTNTSNFSREADRQPRLDAIAKLLNDERIDLAVLQEVDFNTVWSGHHNQAAHIASAAGFKHVMEQRNFDMAFPFVRLRWGNAVLSKYPIVGWQRIQLPVKSRFESYLFGAKKASIVDVKLLETLTVRVFVVHLEPRDETTRMQAAPALFENAKASPFPFFCVGDFNSSPASFPGAATDARGSTLLDVLLTSRLFQTRPTENPSSNQLTWPSYAPKDTIDWIMIPRDWKIVEYRTIPTDLSDHRPVLMEIQAPGAL